MFAPKHLLATLALALSIVSLTALAHGGAYGDHARAWGGMHGWGMVVGPLVLLLILAAIAVLIALIVRWASGGGSESKGALRRKSAIDLLEERFARGEIDREEFLEKRRLLSE